MSFFKTVHQIVRNIPTGRVMSFGDIAGLMGEPRKARFVGFAMRACPHEYPWHRVVKADGSLVIGERQRAMLEREGVHFDADGRVDMDKCKVYPAEMHLMMQSAGEEIIF